MVSLLFASNIGAIGTKILTGAALVKAAPFVVPIACVAVCVGATIAGAKYLSKKLSAKESADDTLNQCACFDDDYADEYSITDDADISDGKDIDEVE
jgi:hypothetical protein